MSRIQRTSLSEDFRNLSIEAGKIGEHNDCSVKAISIACDVPYSEVHALLKSLGRKNGRGTPLVCSWAAIWRLGFKIRNWSFDEYQGMIETYPSPHNGLRSITTHHLRRFPQAWADCHPNMIWVTANHMLAVKDGVVCDWSINRALQVRRIWEIENLTI